METVLNMVIDPDNVRMVLMVVLGWGGFVLINSKMSRMEFSLKREIDRLDHKIDGVEVSLGRRIDGVEASLGKRIDDVEASLGRRIDDVEASLGKRIDEKLLAFHNQLKANDFAHLNSTIEALTYALEKNDSLKKEDKEYIDSRLDR